MVRRRAVWAIAIAALVALAAQVAPAAASSADFAVAVDGPAATRVGGRVTYEVTVTNAGPQGAAPTLRFTRGHGATDTDEGSSFHTVSENASQGDCTNDAKGVICRFGVVAAGAGAKATIVHEVLDSERPKLSLQATVGPEHPDADSDPSNANDHVDVNTPIADPITIEGLPRGCLSKKVILKIELEVANASRTKVIIDGKVVETTANSKLKLKLKPGELSHGSHKLTVVAQAGKGPALAELNRKFKRC
jgi:hypothetical protein